MELEKKNITKLLSWLANPQVGRKGPLILTSPKGFFLPTCGFANQDKSLVMFSFSIPPFFLKKDLSFLHFKVWRYVYFFGCLATLFIIEKKIYIFFVGVYYFKQLFCIVFF